MTAADDAAVLLVAAGGLDVEDDLILSRVAALSVTADPVPEGLAERVQIALALETFDDRLAELELLEAPALAVRSSASAVADTRTCTFAGDDVTVVLRAAAVGEQVRIDGWIAPAARWQVEVRQGADREAVASDPDGRFVVTGLERGMASFVVSDGAGRRLGTPLVEL